MSEVKKCPKCGGEMEEGERFLFPVLLSYLLKALAMRLFYIPVRTVVILNFIKR